MVDFNERLLKEIAHLRYLNGIGIKNTSSLELLRFIRNDELGIEFEEGLKQENEWITANKGR